VGPSCSSFQYHRDQIIAVGPAERCPINVPEFADLLAGHLAVADVVADCLGQGGVPFSPQRRRWNSLILISSFFM
jgi:hypothetical protein